MRQHSFLAVLFIFYLSGCTSPPDIRKSVLDLNSEYPVSVKIKPEAIPEKDKNAQILNRYFNSMTLEEKIGQLFILDLRQKETGVLYLNINEDIRFIINKYNPGGFILFGGNFDTIPQTVKLIKDLQDASTVPLFIATDEEGGRISRLANSEKMHATKIPDNSVIGKTEDPSLAFKTGEIIGSELFALGINMDFAPVADINTNSANSVIGPRAFGSDPQIVAMMVSAEVKGIQSKKVSAVLKHFPGHGDTSKDTHSGSVTVTHTLERLRSVEFLPFKEGITAGVDGIMTAHIQVPKVTGKGIPATFSPFLLTKLLRNELGFNRLIITDSLSMAAIKWYWSSGEAALRAFLAGADILLKPSNIDAAYSTLINAVKEKQISEDRLNESVLRILKIKHKRGILESKLNTLDPEEILGNERHKKIVNEIIKKAALPKSSAQSR